MTRPHIIRADTIDLQAQDAPSAKDHTRQPARPNALGEGPPAPHQADALKHVEHELNEQHGRSPRASQDLSGKELGLLHHEDGEYGAGDEANNLLRNAATNGAAGVEEDAGDVHGDDDLDDDMMDKISSSPSIGDDGALRRPSRGAFFRSPTPPSSSPQNEANGPETPRDVLSSSPFSETPEYYPLSFQRNEQDHTPSKVHHQQGGYTRNQEPYVTMDTVESAYRDRLGSMNRGQPATYFHDEGFDDMEDSYEEDLENLHNLLLPVEDPFLDNSFDDAQLSSSSSASSSPASKISWDSKEPEALPDDDTEDISFVDDARFVDSGWGGECLRETEDIDFEFVYALHTFVATVEGQANATKGDTMVLLDDSNSYWWLVRVVKDSSIGYLPAEHIETPLERLARLNKHRNLDLSQTMLGDEEEKKSGNPLNPLKKAMKRRNAKTVQFTAPSYVEPSDNDYSSEEDEEGNSEFLGSEHESAATSQSNEKLQDGDDSAIVEPLKPRNQVQNGRQNGDIITDQGHRSGLDKDVAPDDMRTSDDTFERSGQSNEQDSETIRSQLNPVDDGTAGKSRKGTVRNTDSFFKDDGVETRKINLTPSLLRDDTGGNGARSNEARDLKTRVSLDSLEKDDPPQRGKEDKKKKEKRGMLGGMFKRKDKKIKGQDKDPEDGDKMSTELSRQSPQPTESLESLSQEAQAAKVTPQPHRQTSKLQKSPPAKLSPKSSYTQREAVGIRPSTAEQQQSTIIPEPSRAPPISSDSNGSMRTPQLETNSVTEDTAPASALNFDPAPANYEEPLQSESPKDGRRGMFSPIRDVLKSSPSDPKPEKARKAKHRMQMDDFDSSSEEDEPTEPPSERESHEEPEERHLAIAQEAQHDEHEPRPLQVNQQYESASRERLSESPVEVPPPQEFQRAPQQDYQRTPPQDFRSALSQIQPRALHQPPPLVVDTSSVEDPSISPVSPLESSPELVEAPHQPSDAREETPASTAQSSTPTWSDASLRAYLDDDSEIRDLLLVVHDKSNVKPARRDHPIVKNMYREENRKLGEISNRLDGLLGEYLARKGRTAQAVR
ncbi:hypothetical protein P7C71_g3454, partial [Lecanoromycetidae sp. Uapishka_2]